jgi:exportin-T
MTIDAKLPEADTPEDDLLLKATTGKTYFQDQLHLFEAAGNLVYLTRNDAARQMSLLEAIAGPIMSGIGSGLERYRKSPEDLQAVLKVHHYLMALGNFAKGFPQASDAQLEDVPYQPPFKQMTEALLQALDVMKTQRVVRDSVSGGILHQDSAENRIGPFCFLTACQCHRFHHCRARPTIRLECGDRI